MAVHAIFEGSLLLCLVVLTNLGKQGPTKNPGQQTVKNSNKSSKRKNKVF